MKKLLLLCWLFFNALTQTFLLSLGFCGFGGYHTASSVCFWILKFRILEIYVFVEIPFQNFVISTFFLPVTRKLITHKPLYVGKNTDR